MPAIVPVVLYHGTAPWPAVRAFEALLDVPAPVRAAVSVFVPRFEYLVDDLSAIPDHQPRNRAMSALATLVAACFKYARTDADLVKRLREWANVMRTVVASPDGLEALAQVVRYILMVNDRVVPDALQALLEHEVGPEAKETIVTVGQRLIEQGIQQGIQHGARALLLRQLRLRFGDAVDGEIERLVAAAPVERVETWAERVLSATTLADVLAD